MASIFLVGSPCCSPSLLPRHLPPQNSKHLYSFRAETLRLANYPGRMKDANQTVLCMSFISSDSDRSIQRHPLDVPLEWERPRPSSRPDVFPQFTPMKMPMPPPLPYDPPEDEEEDEDEEEHREDEEEENREEEKRDDDDD